MERFRPVRLCIPVLMMLSGVITAAQAGITESSAPLVLPPAPQRVTAPAVELRPDFNRHFDALQVQGAFVLLDLKGNRVIRTNPERCEARFLPASTFKILNALMALETGVVPDEHTVIPWNGTQYQIATWNRDQTLKSAMADSTVWAFQELARRMGKERMQPFVDAVGYGNRDLSGPVDSFWLDGGLRISADEQVDFLRRLYTGQLPFSQRSMDIVKRILVIEESPDHRLSGKTGTGQRTGGAIGWFVGALEKGDALYVFATHLEGVSADPAFLQGRIAVTRRILQDLGLLAGP